MHRGTITRWTHDIGKPPRPIYIQHWANLCRVRYEWLAGEPPPRAADPDPADCAGLPPSITERTTAS